MAGKCTVYNRILAIDAGTTSMKAAVFDLEGHLLGIDRQEYQLLMPSPAIVELDAEVYWRACCLAARNAIKHSVLSCRESGAGPSQVAAVCISSQGETLICLDKNGLPVRNAIVWLDNRSVQEAAAIAREFGADQVFHVTGQADIAPTWPACRILWIRDHEPEVFARTSRFLLLEDYLLYRLTGEYATELCLQSDSLLLDITTRTWWGPMFDFLGIGPERLGALMEPGQVVGPLSRSGAEALGLTTQTLAVTGGMDQAMGAVGAGNIVPGIATEATGGALAIVATLANPLFDPQRRVPCHYHARTGTYCLMPWAQTAGMALKWFRDQFYYLESQMAYASNLDPYDLMTRAADTVPAGSDGLVVLPHLEGAACPEFNPAAKAVFFGATLRHTKAHFARGILESVAYMLKKNLDLVEGLGIGVEEVRSIGGGARSTLWLQIKADVLQKPVATVEVEEAALLGAAITGAAGTGIFHSLEEGVSRMVRLKERIEPNPHRASVYQKGYAQYLELYDRLVPLFV